MEEKFIKINYLMGNYEYARYIKPSTINAIVLENNKMFFIDSEVAGNEIKMNMSEIIDLLDRNNLLNNYILCEPKELIKIKRRNNRAKDSKHIFEFGSKVLLNKNSIHAIHVMNEDIDSMMMVNLLTHRDNEEIILTFEDKLYNLDNFINKNELSLI